MFNQNLLIFQVIMDFFRLGTGSIELIKQRIDI